MSDELRDLLDEAYTEETPDEEEVQASAEETEVAAEPEEEETVPGSDSEGGGVSAEDTGGDEGEAAKAEPEEDSKQPDRAAGSYNPPIDWDAGLREHWGKLDPAVQAKISAREGQMAQAMQGTAQARQVAGDLQQLGNQYGSVIAAEGAQNPIQAFQGLLQTTTELRMGTPAQKATKMAELITHFGVDIGMLDNAIVGQPVGNPEVAGMEQMLEQRMAPVNQMMQQLAQMQEQKQYAQQQNVANEVEEFKKDAEFLEDVRQDMGYMINAATQRGEEMTLRDAYTKACAINPQISGILAQRAEQTALTNGKAGLARKKNAASSISGKGQAPAGGGPKSLHEELSSMWDELAG